MVGVDKMKFEYLAAPQRSPEWFAARRGKITASRLEDWLAVSKRDGSPLKSRLDYERELQFERQFGVNYNNFISEAMLDGIDYEDFARRQYQEVTDNQVSLVGCYYNDFFVASPDGLIPVMDSPSGLVEIKVLRDANFSEVLSSGVPDKHWKQIQGGLWASGCKWADYIAFNLTTRKMKVIRVDEDKEFHATLEKSVQEPLSVESFDIQGLFDVRGNLPSPDEMAPQLLNTTEKGDTSAW